MCTEVLLFQIHALKDCFGQKLLPFVLMKFFRSSNARAFFPDSQCGEDHYVIDTIVTAVLSIMWFSQFTFKLQKPRGLNSSLRVFGLGKATPC